ncbi:hypothetical protein TIFTF001_025189 [Ficus carica]|uniref:Uncharacterized protein n=1 Tax=Ficus carica TaxID=3494 RepID=A0AA88B177_FICCA|nr:hypothetical protein TIFTF001_025189 [Ficus carica]
MTGGGGRPGGRMWVAGVGGGSPATEKTLGGKCYVR